jgi:hypothetical protein
MEKTQSRDPGMNIPEFIIESYNQFFGLNIPEFFDADQDLGSGILSTPGVRDPGWEKFKSGMNLRDPQHCFLSLEKVGLGTRKLK